MFNPELQRIYDCIQKETQGAIDNNFVFDDQNEQIRRAERKKTIEQKYLGPLPEEFKKRILDEIYGLGPLEILLQDPEISEILINESNNIWLEKKGQLLQLLDQFYSENSYHQVVERLSQKAGTFFNLESPFLDGHFDHFRISIVHSCITGKSTQLSLRRHPENPWTLEKLHQADWCAQGEVQLLESLIAKRKNFLIVGPTGTGKTSTANACLKKLASNERAIVIEDTSEIKLPNSSCSKLLTRFDPHGLLPAIDQSDLLKKALRLRPDRLVMGEIRGSEAKDFLLMLATGHEGSFATLHAQEPQQALFRLEMLVQMGAPQWNIVTIRRLIQLSLQYVVMVTKNESGHRSLQGIYQLMSLEENGFLFDRVQYIS